jgi:Bacterial low temperature requirement A protein (LtrA)
MGRGHQIAGTQRPSRSLLQDHSGEQRVTSIELFFDLVYVFAVTQMSHHLLALPTVDGALQTALLLALVWWAWVYTTWATNYLDAARKLTYHAAILSERSMRGENVQGLTFVVGGQVLRLRRGHEHHHRRGAAARRVRLRPGLPGGAHDAGCQDHPDP